MKNLIITTILLTLWACLFSQQPENSTSYQENDLQNHVLNKSVNPEDLRDTLVSWCNSVHVPGMSVCILKNGNVYWDLNYGYADIEELKHVSDSTCFILCSASKLFVQTAIMQLSDQDYFELDDSINGNSPQPIVNPNCPDNAITYFHLMTHTSSIVYGFPYLYNFLVWGEDPTIPLGDFMEGSLISGINPTYYNNGYLWGNYCPGTQWNYGSMGHCLLGYLIENMSDQTLENYMQDNIFNPLGINNASYFLSNMDTSYLAVPYNWEYYQGEWQYKPYLQPGAPFYPAAFLKMSAVDLGKFLGMYMKNGSYNGNILLEPETVDLITTPNEGSLYSTPWGQMCLTWMYLEDQDLTYWGGGWDPIASSGIGYDKDDQWGMIFLTSTRLDDNQHFELQNLIVDFAKHYEPFVIENIAVDTDGDQVIEANEDISLGLTLSNYCNFPEMLENITVKISTSSPYIYFTDSVALLSTFNYQDEIQLPANEFSFSVGGDLEPGNIEFQLSLSWDEESEYISSFSLFAGPAEVLLIRDEENRYVGNELINNHDWYLDVLDSLHNAYNYYTHYYDLEIRDNPSPEFINNFPVVIWFTGNDLENTLSEENITTLSTYLDIGGNLFLSGQNISDELPGSNFLQNYFHSVHMADTWNGSNTINGIYDDPIGDGLTFTVNQSNQPSMSIVDPLPEAYKVFGFNPDLDGAAVRYENNNYKSVFFGFGFEAINGFENRFEIMYRILNEYFDIDINTGEEEINIHNTNVVLQVFPNPFSGSVNLQFLNRDQGFVNCYLVDISGEKVKSLINEMKNPGTYHLEIDLNDIPIGVYFCILKTNDGIQTRKLIKL